MSRRRWRPFFPYYGSAWAKTRRGIYPEPDPGAVVVEPFAGAAGYSTYHGVERAELFDIDEVIVETWRYLIGVTPGELLALPDVEPGQPVADLPVCEEARLLIGWWLGRARPRPAHRGGQWFRRYQGGSRFWGEAIRQRLAGQVQAIRRWTVAARPYSDTPRGRRVRFVDPPYRGKPGRGYRHGSAAIDYADLAAWCYSRRGLTVVCEAGGADWLPFRHGGTFKAARGHCAEAVCVLRDGVVVPWQPAVQMGLFGARVGVEPVAVAAVEGVTGQPTALPWGES